MDKITKEKRSEIMSRIRGKDTGIEMELRRALFRRGIRGYRLHRRISGIRPDLVFVGKKIAIFVDGCFWHGCPTCFRMPKTRIGYWKPKIQANVERDVENTRKLESEGWIVLRFWEHEIKKQLPDVIGRIEAALIVK